MTVAGLDEAGITSKLQELVRPRPPRWRPGTSPSPGPLCLSLWAAEALSALCQWRCALCHSAKLCR